MIFIKDYEHAGEIALKLTDLLEKMVHVTPKQSDELYKLLSEILRDNAEFQDYLNHN